MKLLVLEATSSPSQLGRNLSAAALQEHEELTILVITREQQSIDSALLEACRSRSTHKIEVVPLRDDDGLGTLLRLLRKRFKGADTISVSFCDETLSNPHALRRMHAALSDTCSYTACGWGARDGSALRNGEIESGLLHTFSAKRIDSLAVAALDALDACEGSDRRRVLAESLMDREMAQFVDEILVERATASVQVDFEHASAPTQSAPASTNTPAAAPAANAASATTAAAPSTEQASTHTAELEEEPLLAHALDNSFSAAAPSPAPTSATTPVQPTSSPASSSPFGNSSSEIEEDVSELLRGIAGDDTPPPVAATEAQAPGAPAPTLDDEAKALLTELAEEGRLDFAELEASLSKDDPDAIAFVAKLANIPDDLRDRLRTLFVDAGGDPKEFGPNPSATLSIDDADTSEMDDETRALLEAAISGPANLSWQDEVVDEKKSGARAAATPPDNEPTPAALDAALASLQKLEKRIDSGDDAEDEGEGKSALDSFFEDYEREEDGDAPEETEESPKVSALDSFFADGEDFDDEPESPEPAASTPAAPSEAAVDTSDADPVASAKQRAKEAAKLVAENLVVLQQASGEFMEKERYAKECAAALWHHCDPASFRASIQKALDASRRRAEAIALQNRDDGQGPLRAYALSACGFDDQSRTQLDDARSIDTLVEAVLRSRRGQVIDIKRLKHIRKAYDSSGALFDRWMPEDPNASPLSVRDQALAAILIGEIALRNPDDHATLNFARKVEDRLLALARTGTTNGMFVSGAAFRCAERRGDANVMNSILTRFESSNWSGDGSSASDSYCESLAFFGLHLACELSHSATNQ